MPAHAVFDMTGVTRMDFSILNTDGLPMGLTSTTLSNGSDSGMQQLTGIQTAGLSFGQPDITNIVGNAKFQSAYLWRPGEAPTGEIVGANYDMDAAVALDGIKKVTKGDLNMHLLGAAEGTYMDCCGIFQGHAKSRTTGYKGLGIYWGYIVPKMQVAILGTTPMAQRDAVQMNMFVAISMADMYPWGEAYSVANEGATEGVMIPFSAPYPIMMHTYVGDGSTTTLVLDQTPAGDDTASPQKVFVYDATNGAEYTTTTDYTVTVATKTITFQAGSIPAAGEVIIVYYQYVP